MSTARPLRILVFMAKRTASRPVMGSTMPRVSLWPPFFPERESRTLQRDGDRLLLPGQKLRQAQSQREGAQGIPCRVFQIQVRAPVPVERRVSVIPDRQSDRGAARARGEGELSDPEAVAQVFEHRIGSAAVRFLRHLGAEEAHVGLLYQLHGLGELAAEHRLHGDGAGELAAHGSVLPERGHGGQGIRFLAVPAAVLQPAQPLGGVFPVAGHIVVNAQAVGRRDIEWPPHEQLCRGERGLIVRDVFVPDGLAGHGDQPSPVLMCHSPQWPRLPSST